MKRENAGYPYSIAKWNDMYKDIGLNKFRLDARENAKGSELITLRLGVAVKGKTAMGSPHLAPSFASNLLLTHPLQRTQARWPLATLFTPV